MKNVEICNIARKFTVKNEYLLMHPFSKIGIEKGIGLFKKQIGNSTHMGQGHTEPEPENLNKQTNITIYNHYYIIF